MCFFTEAQFAFSIYDADGSNVIDACDLGNVLRALNCNPTNATIQKFGGTEKRGEKTMSVEEFLPIFSDAKKDKDQGCYEDFLECLKLYDKQENGTMLLAELSHLLVTLGENLKIFLFKEKIKLKKLNLKILVFEILSKLFFSVIVQLYERALSVNMLNKLKNKKFL